MQIIRSRADVLGMFSEPNQGSWGVILLEQYPSIIKIISSIGTKDL